MQAGRRNHHDDERDHQLDCLARYICNLAGGLPERRRFIDRMQLSHGKQFADELKQRVTEEWNKRHE